MIDSLGQGGAEHSLAAMLPKIAHRGFVPEVVCRYQADSHVAQNLMDNGIRVTTMPRSHPVAAGRWLRAHLRSTEPALLHLNLFVPTIVGAVSSLGLGVPIVVSLVSTPQNENPAIATWKLRAVKEAEGFVCRRRATIVHAVTPGVASAAARDLRIPSSKIKVAERGRDPSRFRPGTPAERQSVRHSLGIRSEATVIAAVGRHEYQKGFDVLLSAIGGLQSDHPDLVLVLPGNTGTESPALEEQRSALPRPNDVLFLGNRDDVEDVLRSADLFVLSSRREGAAGAAIEAMATGLAIVASELEGTSGVLRHDHDALLVPPEDPGALTAAIDRVLRNPELARHLGRVALATFSKRFTLARSVQSLAEVYRAAIDAS